MKQLLDAGWDYMEWTLRRALECGEEGRYELPPRDRWDAEIPHWWEVRKPAAKRIFDVVDSWDPDPYGEAQARENNWYKGLRKWNEI